MRARLVAYTRSRAGCVTGIALDLLETHLIPAARRRSDTWLGVQPHVRTRATLARRLP